MRNRVDCGLVFRMYIILYCSIHKKNLHYLLMQIGGYLRNTRQIPFVCRFLSTRASNSRSSENILHSAKRKWSIAPSTSGLHYTRKYPTTLLRSSLGKNLNSSCRWYSLEPTPITDPSRPGLFYHVLSPPTPISSSIPAFGISFLSTPPPSVESSAIIGWLPAASEGQGQEVSLGDFKENRESCFISSTDVELFFESNRDKFARSEIIPAKFRSILHEAIQAGLRDEVDDTQKNGALQLQHGWMHIHGI